MKTGKIKGIFSILGVMLLLITLIIPSSASPAHEAVLLVENNTVFIAIPAPEKLTSIDLSVVLNTDIAVISSVSLEDCDTNEAGSDISDIPDIPEEATKFIYKYTFNEDSLSFSGYFIESFSADTDFIICKIILSDIGTFTDNDTAELSYTLNCELCSKSDSVLYSIKNKTVITDTALPSYPLGDADTDGNVSAADARLILRASVGLEAIPLAAVAYTDSDYDGAISASDARYALRSSVGLEKQIMHRFDISLEDGASCENGGIYTFICDITGKEFTIEIPNGGHILTESDCFSTGKCTVCNTDIQPATGHRFDENGSCTTCSADKEQLSTIEAQLIPMLEEINTCDTLADEYLTGGDKSEFISYTQTATKLIKKAAELCDNVKGMEEIHSHLYKAYKIRFSAYTACMDDDGAIFVNSKNCDTILNAVKLSNTHIDYASYLYE